MSIVHIIPQHVFVSADQGSYKDVEGRVDCFRAHDREYIQIKVGADNPVEVLAGMGDANPAKIFIEYSYFPKILRVLRERWPTATIAVRAHNIEPLQNIADKGFAHVSQIPRVLYGSLRRLAADVQMRRQANFIFAINDWEIDNYWRYIPGGAQLRWLPYFSPELGVAGCHSSARSLVLCLPNRSVNRKSHDLVSRFCAFAKIGGDLRPDLTFAITRDPRHWGVEPSDNICILGFRDDLRELLSQTLAVAILSPLGFGFKTTIMDAVGAGAWAITDRRLYKRVPEPVRTCCVSIGALRAGNVARVLDATTNPLPPGSLNGQLKLQAEEILINEFIN